ncbi:MAG: sulfite exporter TauE/SafE family protein [Sporomusaceae bacterium]|nr:sulfite exporter TauE/SafE family protein [Sporomusaceae bacterium]
MVASTLLFVFVTTAFSSFLQTVTGFGYALAAAPLLALFMDPKEAVMLVLATGAITKIMLLAGAKIQGRFTDIAPLFLASLLGALPGAYLISAIGVDALRAFIGIILLTTTAAMCANCRVRIQRPRLAESAVGMLSGFLGATTSLSGPPLVLYYLNENAEKDLLRANLTRYFLLGNLATLLLSYSFGTLRPEALLLPVLISIPAVAFGVWLGEKLFCRLDPPLFRKLAISVISVSGMITVYNGLQHAFQAGH